MNNRLMKMKSMCKSLLNKADSKNQEADNVSHKLEKIEDHLVKALQDKSSVIIGGANDSDIQKLKTDTLTKMFADDSNIEMLNAKTYGMNKAVLDVYNEMKKRYIMLQEMKARDLNHYNTLVADGDKLKRQIVVIDNIEQFFEAFTIIPMLTQKILPKARAVGIIIVATINTDKIRFEVPKEINVTEIQACQSIMARFKIRVGLQMNDVKDAEIMLIKEAKHYNLLNLKTENKALKISGYYGSQTEEYDFEYIQDKKITH